MIDQAKKTFYEVPYDGALIRCFVCNNLGDARHESFVKIQGLFGARHASCVTNLDTYQKVGINSPEARKERQGIEI